MKKQKLTFDADLIGIVNGQKIKLSGEGSIDEGHTNGLYNLSEIPKNFDPFLLSVVLVTGYPNASKSHDDVSNIFIGNSYHYTRNIQFNDGGNLSLKTTCDLKNEHLSSTFELSGDVNYNNLNSVEPIVETWEPIGPGKIAGYFMASWYCEARSEMITAKVDSRYYIDTRAYQSGLAHRFIKINNSIEGETLHKLQDVVLFNDLPII